MKTNTKLPILSFREVILDNVKNNPVTIITAETGAGKSTQVPQFLMEEGYQVVVTQPRRLAVRTVAQRVAEEAGCKLGDKIGYRTGFERKDSPTTQVLFCTDGLQMIREITGTGRTQVLVIDEVHEWNINIETLVAWTRKQIVKGWKIKVVLMSATIETDRLAKFYGKDVPVVKVPGRLFPVKERRDSEKSLIKNIKQLVEKKRNVLVFQPGKKEIAETVEKLEALKADSDNDFNAVILPLHGELDIDEQNKCFCSYSQPKVVVATNVAQTSITIPDIDAVIDSGVERRVELKDGIEGLYLKPISRADCSQRKGRSGRTKEGIYILCSDVSMSERPKFPTAEIERVRLDQLVLRLAAVDIDATKLAFFHQPDTEILIEAKRALHALGAMSNDQVTKIGHFITKLPLSVQFARMIVNAEKFEVVDDVITIAAILEVGGIRDRSDKWRTFTEETESDLLAELDLWNIAQGKRAKELADFGIFKKSYFRAKEIREKLAWSLRGLVKFGSTGNREDIKKSCIAGMVDHLYQNDGGEYRNGDDSYRQKARESVLTNNPEWIVGLPKDIQFKNRDGDLCTLNLVSMLTKVDPRWLMKVAPQLVEINEGLEPFFDPKQDSCMSTTETLFNGQKVKEEVVATPKHKEACLALAEWLAEEDNINNDYIPENLRKVLEYNNINLKKQAEELNIRAGEIVFSITSSERQDWLFKRLKSARRIVEISDFEILRFSALDAKTVKKVLVDNPDTVKVGDQIFPVGYRKGPWKDSYHCTLSVTEEFARDTEIETVILPGGRTVELWCKGITEKSFSELIKKLEKK